jgi:hemolysin III
MAINRGERFSHYSHLGGAVAGVAGLGLLVVLTWGRWGYFAVSMIFGLAFITLFTFSALYHAYKKCENEINLWRKLDHIAIFIMIAGTYTPVSYVYLDGGWRLAMFVIPWGLALLGVFFKLFWLRAPRVLSPVLYLGMGWMAIMPLKELFQAMPLFNFILLGAGGVAYSIGALIYGFKRPNPVPGVFGFHEIFHAWILIGAILHYTLIVLAVG